MSAPFAQGQIVWVVMPDSEGINPKLRPAVILTQTKDIQPTGQVSIAAITTDIGRARLTETVELPFTSDGKLHPITKLKKQGEVVCSWVHEVDITTCYASGGVVPTGILAEVLHKAAKCS